MVCWPPVAVGRAEVRRQIREWTKVPLYRICEADDELVTCWLPGIEPDDPGGCLDRGGFGRRSDAVGFSLGINWERAYHGQLDGITTADIDEERGTLDGYKPKQTTRAEAA